MNVKGCVWEPVQRYFTPYAELKGLLTDIGSEKLGHKGIAYFAMSANDRQHQAAN